MNVEQKEKVKIRKVAYDESCPKRQRGANMQQKCKVALQQEIRRKKFNSQEQKSPSWILLESRIPTERTTARPKNH